VLTYFWIGLLYGIIFPIFWGENFIQELIPGRGRAKIQPFSASSSGHIHSFQLVMPAIVPNFLFLSFKELSVI